jgi:TonB family protein
MIAPLILLALVTGSPGSAPVRELKPNELRALFSPNDYPLEARLNRWEGATVVELMVNSSGEPIKCHIVKSSGHPLLDNKACWVLTNRARYRPVKDEAGKPVQTTFKVPPITWSAF